MTLNIAPLSQCPEFAETCAAWSFGSWGCHLEGRTLSQSIKGYKERTQNKNIIPLTWVGIINKKIIGMISLVKNDHEERKDLSPWLASMFVHPDYRKKGYASILIQFLHKEAKKLGFTKLYLYTPDAQELYLKNNWKITGQITSPQGIQEFDHLMEIEL